MPYKVDEYLSVAVPGFVARDSVQSMGTARAETDIVRLPGGGVFDGQGDYQSPLVLDNITKGAYLYPVSGLTILQQLDALRAQVGFVGRLDVRWDLSTVRWVRARLVSVTNPRRYQDTQQLPVNLIYQPIGDHYLGESLEVESEVWSGVTMDDDFIVTNPGTIRVQFMRIVLTIADAGGPEIIIDNLTTSQRITIEPSVSAGWEVIIDTEQKRVRIHETPINIASIERAGNQYLVETAAPITLAVGTVVYLSGAGFDDGYYTVEDDTDSTHFILTADSQKREEAGPYAMGTVSVTVPIYGDATFSDRAGWFSLAPGANDIHIESDMDLDGSSIDFEFYAAYA